MTKLQLRGEFKVVGKLERPALDDEGDETVSPSNESKPETREQEVLREAQREEGFTRG